MRVWFSRLRQWLLSSVLLVVPLAWDASVPTPEQPAVATGYRLYWRTNPAMPYTAGQSVDTGNRLTWNLDIPLESGRRYYVVARAYSATGDESPDSNELSLGGLDAPGTLLAQLAALEQQVATLTTDLAAARQDATTVREGLAIQQQLVAGWKAAAQHPVSKLSFCDHWKAVSASAKDTWRKVYGTEFPFGGAQVPCPPMPQ